MVVYAEGTETMTILYLNQISLKKKVHNEFNTKHVYNKKLCVNERRE